MRFNEEAKKDPALRDEGRAWFKRLEDGDPEAVALWERFRQVSLAAFEEVYRVLGVRFDEISGESKYDKLMPDTIRRLKEMGLAKLDQGALIVDLSADKMPPVLLRKSDGATLYDTRDIAAAEDRWNRYHFARMIYVVGGDQKLHFRQIFKVLEMMGYPWAKDCVHVDFGMVRMKGAEGAGKMSGRRGEVVMLRDVLREAIERARQAIEAKNPDLADKERVAAAVGIGAVVFNDLKRQRIKDVDFDWDAILSFEGETGPYVQYAHARLCSILRKYGQAPAERVNFSLLAEPEEFALAKAMAGLGPDRPPRRRGVRAGHGQPVSPRPLHPVQQLLSQAQGRRRRPGPDRRARAAGGRHPPDHRQRPRAARHGGAGGDVASRASMDRPASPGA